ncbi:MAG: thioredoxin [Gemmatimonadetes bacterium]|jgi:putative thioredoxin|nr:thioredoxin [Gemmatimonadota bacterium]
MEAKPQIFDVDRNNFEEAVLKGSQERLIVVDFWAPWCEPCRTLGPILEGLVAELGSGVALAKVNVDENQELAQAFRVQGIPAVKIVKDGQLVQEFTGALPKEQIEAILRPLVPAVEREEEEDLHEQATQLAILGDLDGAARLYEKILEEKPEEGPAILGLAKIRLQQGDFDALQELVNLIEEGSPEYQQARALLSQIEFVKVCLECGGRAVCAQKMLADPDNLDARYSFACCAAAEGDFETALKEWLTVVERQSSFRDGAAKDSMVAVFHLLGRENEMVGEYQRRLYQALY